MHRISLLFIAATFLITSCGSRTASTERNFELSSDEQVSSTTIASLICGSQTGCLSNICEDANKCPLHIALSNQVLFDFVKTYSECDECNTKTFNPAHGIGKCIEYKTTETSRNWTVKIWVSENCAFRHSDPTQTNLSVQINKITLLIEHINPDIAYIEDPSYCSVDSDCYGLSGSGVPLIGCSNIVHAPLNLTGHYENGSGMCECKVNQCKQK
jgi:hypothetical protein